MSDNERNDVPSQIDWLARFTSKVGLGACICEGQEISAAIDEIERLTAALQYEQHRAGRQGTHGDGCADWGPEHYECAIRERDELRRQLAEAELDAQRYRWLRSRFFAADFAYSDPPVCAIVFRWPESAKISANLDREIDAAMGASNE